MAHPVKRAALTSWGKADATPLYTMGQNQFDTSPLENALWKYAQHQEQQRQNAFRQQQIDMDRTRLGYEGERLGFERIASRDC